MSSWKTISRASLLAALLGGSALAQQPIEVERLDALDPLEVGLPGAGLGNGLWTGTDRDLAVAVLGALPAAADGRYGSEAVSDLARAVLATGGQPPAGGRGDSDLAVLRVDRLVAASSAGDAFDLLERTPGINRMPQLAYWHAELGFATGNPDRACRTADALIDDRDTAYWLRARAFCLALQDRAAAAELTAELARSQGEDEGFDARLFAITLGMPLAADAPGADTGLEWAMQRYLDAASAEGGADDGPGLAADAPLWLRRAAHDAMGGHDRPVADPVAALVAAQSMDGMERHHALEAVLAQGQDREMSGRALGLLLADTGGGARFVHVARHHGREIDSLPITAATLEHGYEIALAAVLVGDLRAANAWRDALIDGPPRARAVGAPADIEPGLPGGMAAPGIVAEPEWVPPSPRRMVALDLAIAIASDRMGGGGFEAVLAAWAETGGDSVLPDLLALNRLGAPEAPGLRAGLLAETPDAAPVPGLAAMDAAVRARARAEAALDAIAVLNRPGAASDPDALSRAIGALDAAGLRRQALAVMLERVVQGAL